MTLMTDIIFPFKWAMHSLICANQKKKISFHNFFYKHSSTLYVIFCVTKTWWTSIVIQNAHTLYSNNSINICMKEYIWKRRQVLQNIFFLFRTWNTAKIWLCHKIIQFMGFDIIKSNFPVSSLFFFFIFL